jgi:hypothetical protein
LVGKLAEAVPLESVAVARVVPENWNWTEPVGVGPPPVTAALKVTLPPAASELGVIVNAVVLDASTTTMVVFGEVEALSFASPA